MTGPPSNEPPPPGPAPDPSPDSPNPQTGGNGGGASKKTDRELVEAALRAAKPRSATPVFNGEPLPPPESFPGYEITREIHRGGQGVVYQAIQKTTKRKVALKVMHGGPFTGSKGRARFEREVAILAQLQHPNIVSVLDSGNIGGQAYYVMDYVSGQTLDAWMAAGKTEPKPIQEVLNLFIKICDAVNAAHLKGITHRDLKPSNIRIDHSGEPHVLDFGLAKVVIGEVTEETQPQVMSVTGQFIGSLPWASPEQAEGVPSKVDLRTDVYSLGVILYQLLTGGKFPYEVIGNMRDVMDNILRAEPARPSTIRRQINDEVETIVLKTLQKERERRYQSAGELARDLKRYLAGEPIEAMRESGWYVIRKTLNRYRVQTGVAVAFLALLVVFGVVSFALYQKVRVEARRADAATETFKNVMLAGRDLQANMLDEVYNSFDRIVGTTESKKKIVVAGAAYLEKLEKAASDDPAFLTEYAAALEAVGRLQTTLGTARVTSVADGRTYLEKAMKIREGLLASAPQDAGRNSAIGETHRLLAQADRLERRFDDALAHLESALTHAATAVAKAPGQGAGADAQGLFNLRRTQAEVMRAEIKLRKAECMSDLTAAQALFKEVEDEYASLLVLREDQAKGNPASSSAARLAVVWKEKPREPAMARGKLLRREGDRRAAAKDANGAKEMYDAALKEFARAREFSVAAEPLFLALVDPAKASDPDLARAILITQDNIGDAQRYMGLVRLRTEELAAKPDLDGARKDLTQAHERLARCTEAAINRAANEDGNLDAQRTRYAFRNRTAEALRDLGKVEHVAARVSGDQALNARGDSFLKDALGMLAHSKEETERAYERDKTRIHREDKAVVYGLLGSVEKERGQWQAARTWYENAKAEYDSLKRDGAPFPPDDYQDVEDGLRECKAKMEGK